MTITRSGLIVATNNLEGRVYETDGETIRKIRDFRPTEDKSEILDGLATRHRNEFAVVSKAGVVSLFRV